MADNQASDKPSTHTTVKDEPQHVGENIKPVPRDTLVFSSGQTTPFLFSSGQTTPFRWLLTRADDDGSLVGIELDDFQIAFVRHDTPRGPYLKVNLSRQQVQQITQWWRDP